jgi:hypothetical protein
MVAIEEVDDSTPIPEKKAPNEDSVTAEDDGADKAEAVTKQPASAEEAKATPATPPNPVAIAFMPLACVVVAVVSVFMQQAGGDVSIQGVQKWQKSLFEPHVVLPPNAGSNEVVIQFCQS